VTNSPNIYHICAIKSYWTHSCLPVPVSSFILSAIFSIKPLRLVFLSTLRIHGCCCHLNSPQRHITPSRLWPSLLSPWISTKRLTLSATGPCSTRWLCSTFQMKFITGWSTTLADTRTAPSMEGSPPQCAHHRQNHAGFGYRTGVVRRYCCRPPDCQSQLPNGPARYDTYLVIPVSNVQSRAAELDNVEGWIEKTSCSLIVEISRDSLHRPTFMVFQFMEFQKCL